VTITIEPVIRTDGITSWGVYVTLDGKKTMSYAYETVPPDDPDYESQVLNKSAAGLVEIALNLKKEHYK
jgi:hypothetical protein